MFTPIAPVCLLRINLTFSFMQAVMCYEADAFSVSLPLFLIFYVVHLIDIVA